MDALTTRVTIATDDTHMGAVGAASDIDGVVHGQLRYLGDYLTTIDSDTNTIQGDTTSIDGKTPALGSAAMAASVPVTLASDDTNTVDIPNVIGTDGAAGPSKAISIGGTDGSGNLQEVLTDSDGHVQVDVLSSTGSVVTSSVTSATGAAAIAATTGAFAQNFELDSITLHLSAAGTTSENFTVTLDANDDPGAQEYDTTLLSLDLSTDSVTDLVITPEQDGLPKLYETGDAIDIAWPNTETRTYGLRIVGKLI